MPNAYAPPLTLSATMLARAADIAQRIGQLQAGLAGLPAERVLRLRRISRVRSIQSTLAIEGNTLTLDQVTAILEGKRVLASPREVQEVRNALQAYEHLARWEPTREVDLLAAHALMMHGLVDYPGRYRGGGVGVMDGDTVVHMAPPASRVPALLQNLLAWLARGEQHPLIAACLFHYELEFIHPFDDGNGRMGRLWQPLILSRWQPLFADLPTESLVRDHQQDYYRAIAASNVAADAAPFVELMLDMIEQTLVSLAATPEHRGAADAATGANPVEASAAQLVREHVRGPVREHDRDRADAGLAGAGRDRASDAPSEPVLRLLRALLARPGSTKSLMRELGLAHRPSFLYRWLQPALRAGWVEMTDPDHPKSPRQRYRLATAGRRVLADAQAAAGDAPPADTADPLSGAG